MWKSLVTPPIDAVEGIYRGCEGTSAKEENVCRECFSAVDMTVDGRELFQPQMGQFT